MLPKIKPPYFLLGQTIVVRTKRKVDTIFNNPQRSPPKNIKHIINQKVDKFRLATQAKIFPNKKRIIESATYINGT